MTTSTCPCFGLRWQRAWGLCVAFLLCGLVARPCSAQPGESLPADASSDPTSNVLAADDPSAVWPAASVATAVLVAGSAPEVPALRVPPTTALPRATQWAAEPAADDTTAGTAPAGTLAARSSTGPPSRARAWRSRREAKRESMSPPSSNWLERTGELLSRTQSVVLGDRVVLDVPEVDLFGLRPAFGGLPSGAELGGGLYYQPPFLKGPGRHVHAEALMSLNGYYAGEAIYGSESGPYVHYAYARYHHLPQQEFYGAGPESRKESEAGYRLNEILVGGLFGRSVTDELLVGTHVSYSGNRYGPGTDAGVPQVADAFGDVTGVGRNADYVMVGSFVEYDSRDVPYDRGYGERFAPTKDRLRRLSLDAESGFYLSSRITHHLDVGGDRLSFTRFSLDLQEYLSIDEGTHHGFAFRQFVSLTHTAGDQQVPFYRLQSIGGSESLRGYTSGRFRDYNVLLMNAEVRCEVWHWLDMAVFGDAGHVFRRFDDLGADTVRGNAGIGFRLRTDEGTAARVEFARGTEGTRVVLQLGSLL